MELTLEQRREQRVLFEKALPVAKQSHWYDHNCTYGDAYVDGRWRSWCEAVEVNGLSEPNAKYDDAWIAEQLSRVQRVADPKWYNEAGIVTDDGFVKMMHIFANRVLTAFGDRQGMREAFSTQNETEQPLRDALKAIAIALDAAGVPDGTVLERVTALVAVKPVPEVLDWPDGEGPGFWWIKRSGFPAEVCHVLTYHTLLVMDTGKYTRDDVAANGWQFIRATPPVFPGSTSC